VIDYFAKFFDTSDFPARWYCGNWSDFLGWLHIISDVAIFGAYFAIPIVLIYFARKRKDFPFTKLFFLFATFIFACGTTHLIDATIFWQPIYRVSGFMKFVTAIVSWATVVALARYVPQVLHFPSLPKINEELKAEISRREESQRLLQEAKDRHDALLEGTRSIVWITDAQGHFIVPQLSWQRYTGQTFDEHRDLGWTKAIHEDDLPDLNRSWQLALKEGTKYESSGRLWHAATQSYRSFLAEAVPLKNADGTIREWIGTVSDVEDQQQAEAALGVAQQHLLDQKRELELIYEAAPVGLSLLDRDHRFLRINETLATINGFPREQHIGVRAEELLPDLVDTLTPIYDAIFKTGTPKLNVEIVGRTPASTVTRTWLASFFPITASQPNTSGDHEVVAVNAIVQDITLQKRMEKRLRESEAAALAASRSKSEFLANMSHEIRTPMAAIMGYADVLLGHLHDPDNRNCVLVMKRNGEHLLDLLNDILDLSRIEAGKLDVETESVPLPQLVADIQSLMQVRAEEKKVRFQIDFEGKVPRTIQTDPTRLRQVLINLIGNAIKFTDGGEVRLKVSFEEDFVDGHAANCPSGSNGAVPKPSDPGESELRHVVQFAIADTGIGMSEDQIDRLFKPFSQGDSSVTRQYGGSGLGLAISQRLVRMMDGNMDLKSELGVGSTFIVRLPVASFDDIELIKPDLVVRRDEPETSLAEVPELSCRVLVVDDRRDVRHISQHFLEKAGAHVSTAEDGQRGIDAALRARDDGQAYDLIVMDMQMPNIDGLHATAQLRSAGIDWPIIALTADAMKGDRERCLNGGCDDYLSKPIDHAKLVRMVSHYTQSVTHQELRQRRADRAAALKASLHSEF
jgi:PAS domain S-box-containing protein